MKKKSNLKGFYWLIGILAFLVVLVLVASRFGHLRVQLPLEHSEEFTSKQINSFPTSLKVSGNQLVNADGQIIRLRGVMIQDPYVLAGRGRFKQELIQEVAATGANVIRVPIHPSNWISDPDYLWRYLDPLVEWAGENNLYVILDLHYIGNIVNGAGEQMPDIDRKPVELSTEFWTLLASHYKDTPNVLFEIFNEPQGITSEDWRKSAEQLVQVIRNQGADQVIIVGGINYAKDLSWVLKTPVEGNNIAYASHIYPAHTKAGWKSWFGAVSDQYPVLITEWGFMQPSTDSNLDYLVGTEQSFGSPFLSYLDEKNIGWVACWYDDEWNPPMFTASFKGHTPFGDFVLHDLGR
jgi:aryl-phospho-beta-D-glucosidase BglC (GH1 family)